MYSTIVLVENIFLIKMAADSLFHIFPSWSSRPNPKDRINKKPDDRKNDQTTENAKNPKTKTAALNLIFSKIYIFNNFNMLIGKVKILAYDM